MSNLVSITVLGCNFSFFKRKTQWFISFPCFSRRCQSSLAEFVKTLLYTACNPPASTICLILKQRRFRLQANFDLKLTIRDLSPVFMKKGMLRMGSKGVWRTRCKAELSDACCFQLVFVWSCWWPIDPVSLNWGAARGTLHMLSVMLINFLPINWPIHDGKMINRSAVFEVREGLRHNPTICSKFYTGVQVRCHTRISKLQDSKYCGSSEMWA